MRINDSRKSNFAYKLIGVFVILLILIYILLNLPIGSLKKVWSVNTQNHINTYQISPSGEWVAVGQADGLLLLYQQDGEVFVSHQFDDPVRKIVFSLDEKYVYVNTSIVSCFSIHEKKVIWQKFKKDFSIEDFWVYRNQELGFLFSSKFNLNRLFTHTNPKGVTTYEFSLPEMFERYHVESSDNGLFVLICQSNGDMYAYQNGSVLWNNHLDPPVIEKSVAFPLLTDINNEGYTIIAYTASEYGKTTYLSLILDNKGEITWNQRAESSFLAMQFAQDSTKWLLSMEHATQVLDLKGNILFQRKQYGYSPVWASLGNTTVLVGYNAYKKTSDESLKGTIIKLFALKKEYVIWQKKVIAEFGEYQVNRTGSVMLEVLKPNQANLYRWSDKNLIRKVFLWLF